ASTVRPRLVVTKAGPACDAVRAGIGLGRGASYYVGAAIEAGTLTTVLDEFQLPTRPVSFVYASGRFMPIKLRAFLDFAAPRLKARLARSGVFTRSRLPTFGTVLFGFAACSHPTSRQ